MIAKTASNTKKSRRARNDYYEVIDRFRRRCRERDITFQEGMKAVLKLAMGETPKQAKKGAAR